MPGLLRLRRQTGPMTTREPAAEHPAPTDLVDPAAAGGVALRLALGAPAGSPHDPRPLPLRPGNITDVEDARRR